MESTTVVPKVTSNPGNLLKTYENHLKLMKYQQKTHEQSIQHHILPSFCNPISKSHASSIFPYPQQWVPSIPDGHAEDGAEALDLPGYALRGHGQAAEHGAGRGAEAELQQGGAIEDAQAVLRCSL